VPAENVELGPNLVEHGGFEGWVDGSPRSWTWSDMATGDLWNKGIFIGGADGLEAYSGSVARVNGLWLQHRQDKEPGRSGYWQADPITLTTASPYVLSFYYRTERTPDNAATIWVSYDTQVLFSGDHPLPATDGNWWLFAIVGWNRSAGEAAVRPLLRSFAPGQVWFDDVQLRNINIRLSVQTREAQFMMLPGD